MNSADVDQVFVLSSRIRTFQQAITLLDAGATISALTLQSTKLTKVPKEPEPDTEAREEPETEDESETTPPQGEVPTEPEYPEEELGEVTIPAEGLTYPPQMIQAIRQQEIALWKEAAEALTKLGVTDVPQPPQPAQPH